MMFSASDPLYSDRQLKMLYLLVWASWFQYQRATDLQDFFPWLIEIYLMWQHCILFFFFFVAIIPCKTYVLNLKFNKM